MLELCEVLSEITVNQWIEAAARHPINRSRNRWQLPGKYPYRLDKQTLLEDFLTFPVNEATSYIDNIDGYGVGSGINGYSLNHPMHVIANNCITKVPDGGGYYLGAGRGAHAMQPVYAELDLSSNNGEAPTLDNNREWGPRQGIDHRLYAGEVGFMPVGKTVKNNNKDVCLVARAQDNPIYISGNAITANYSVANGPEKPLLINYYQYDQTLQFSSANAMSVCNIPGYYQYSISLKYLNFNVYNDVVNPNDQWPDRWLKIWPARYNADGNTYTKIGPMYEVNSFSSNSDFQGLGSLAEITANYLLVYTGAAYLERFESLALILQAGPDVTGDGQVINLVVNIGRIGVHIWRN